MKYFFEKIQNVNINLSIKNFYIAIYGKERIW